jgi:hypothetical protein
MTTPPDYGGREIEEGLEEDLGVPREEIETERHPGQASPRSGGHEAHAPGNACERCGDVITSGQDARRLPNGKWVHEACP